MTKWPIKTLGDLVIVQNGYAFDSNFFSSNGKIGLIRIRDLKGGVDTEARYEGLYDDDYVVSAGDYLIGMDGEFRCYEWQGEPALLNQRVCRLRGFDKSLESRFLFYGINKFLKDIEDVTGYTTVKHLSSKSILAIKMPVPPLEEQKRIIELLDAATGRVTELTACYEQARTDANNLFTSAMRASFESNPDWPVKTLSDVCRIEMGRTPSRGDSRGWDKEFKTSNHWASIADLSACSGRVLTSTKERISNLAAKTTKVVPAGTLMMSFKLSIGKLAFAGCDLYTNEAIAAFHLPEQSEIGSDFLYWALSVVDWSALTRGSEKVKGAAMNKAKLNLLDIPVPPLVEQKQIVARLDSMRAKTSEMVAAFDAKLEAAKNLRQSILEAAFAGEL
jgi:type I restriction enzyme S subunit